MPNILIIEDEKNLARFVELELKHEGYHTKIYLKGEEGLKAALDENKDWDIILLDLMLPEISGIEICKQIRETSSVPIIMMTAKDSIIDRVTGLNQGADDYLVKPFAIEELLARIKALLRRVDASGKQGKESLSVLEFDDLIVEKENRIVRRGDEIIELTKREYDLFVVLIENVNHVQSRKDLLKKVWGYTSEVETNLVDVYIRYIRNKIDKPGEESYIKTVRGTGYVMRN